MRGLVCCEGAENGRADDVRDDVVLPLIRLQRQPIRRHAAITQGSISFITRSSLFITTTLFALVHHNALASSRKGASKNKAEIVFFAGQVYVKLVLVGINFDDVLTDQDEDALAAAQRRAFGKFQCQRSGSRDVCARETLRHDERQSLIGRQFLLPPLVPKLSLRVTLRREPNLSARAQLGLLPVRQSQAERGEHFRERDREFALDVRARNSMN